MAGISPLTRLRELMARPGFIPALGIRDPYTARVAEAMGMPCVHIGGYQLSTYPTALLCPVTQELKRVITNFRTRGESGLDNEKI